MGEQLQRTADNQTDLKGTRSTHRSSAWELVQGIAGAVRKNASRRLFKPSPAIRDALLLDASVALRGGRFEEAAALLDSYWPALIQDAGYLNLLGVATEKRGQLPYARTLYRAAVGMNPQWEAARINLRRLEESGAVQRGPALGDQAIRTYRVVS